MGVFIYHNKITNDSNYDYLNTLSIAFFKKTKEKYTFKISYKKFNYKDMENFNKSLVNTIDNVYVDLTDLNDIHELINKALNLYTKYICKWITAEDENKIKNNIKSYIKNKVWEILDDDERDKNYESV